MTSSPVLTFNNGVQMPALGLGVFQSSRDDTVGAVTAALEAGYRLIDTAAIYGNEQQVGDAIAGSSVDRGDIFLTTKLWIRDFGFDSALRAFDDSLRRLSMDYVDLYLIHWPAPSQFDRTVAAYRAMEQLLAEGRVRAIGVSNFTPAHLDRLMSEVEVVPAVNQVELHPYFQQHAVRAADEARRIITQSWSPIGGVNIYDAKDPSAARRLLEDPVVVGIAESHARTAAQGVLRWHLDHGLSAIPKSVHAGRILENFDVFGFALSDADRAALDALDVDARGGMDPDVFEG